MRYQVGIDEAGRGCMLGSLFLAGVTIDLENQSLLQSLNLMDSKGYGSSDAAKKKGQKSA